MKNKILISIAFLLLLSPMAWAKTGLKIGYVHMNKAINLSIEGRRSRKFLEAQAVQTQNFLRGKREKLIQKEQELKGMMMLSSEAKAAKIKELRELKANLDQAVAKAQKSLMADEKRHTGKIFNDLKVIVKKIAEKRKLDFVLEFAIKQTILYGSDQFIDLTDEIVDEYDKLQTLK